MVAIKANESENHDQNSYNCTALIIQRQAMKVDLG
jgi:hypothetical protein